MAAADPPCVEALIVALPESAGSAIYGLIDVFGSTGTLWREVVGDEPGRRLIQPRIVSLSRDPFRCGNGIPVSPDVAIDESPSADIVVVPEVWIAPHDDLSDRYSEVKEWLRQRYRAGIQFIRCARAQYCWPLPDYSRESRRRHTGLTRNFSVAAFRTSVLCPSQPSSLPTRADGS